MGHDEYRRVTYRDIHFRRAFAEVFRHRSLLFLGSGIRETYLQELLERCSNSTAQALARTTRSSRKARSIHSSCLRASRS